MSDEREDIFTALGIPVTLVGSSAWNELEKIENSMGEEALLDKIINERLWSNAEIAWIIKKMLYYYGRQDPLLKKTPTDRIFMNMADILRCFFLLLDITNPEVDDNMRSYISSKLADATWGINNRTRKYLHKMERDS